MPLKKECCSSCASNSYCFSWVDSNYILSKMIRSSRPATENGNLILEIKNLSHSYDETNQIIQNINLEIEK